MMLPTGASQRKHWCALAELHMGELWYLYLFGSMMNVEEEVAAARFWQGFRNCQSELLSEKPSYMNGLRRKARRTFVISLDRGDLKVAVGKGQPLTSIVGTSLLTLWIE
jgi:hypothetical protein